jgi:hypothetical protein
VGQEGTPQGSSALAITRLANRKGYSLIAATKSNLIFVLNRYEHKFDDYPRALPIIFDVSCINYVLTDYLGNYRIEGILPYGMVSADDTMFK